MQSNLMDLSAIRTSKSQEKCETARKETTPNDRRVPELELPVSSLSTLPRTSIYISGGLNNICANQRREGEENGAALIGVRRTTIGTISPVTIGDGGWFTTVQMKEREVEIGQLYV